MKKAFVAALMLNAILMIGDVSAQTNGIKRGGVCVGQFINASSIISCDHIGNVKIKQIYEKGFRVVQMLEVKTMDTVYVTIVIEQQ